MPQAHNLAQKKQISHVQEFFLPISFFFQLQSFGIFRGNTRGGMKFNMI